MLRNNPTEYFNYVILIRSLLVIARNDFHDIFLSIAYNEALKIYDNKFEKAT